MFKVYILIFIRVWVTKGFKPVSLVDLKHSSIQCTKLLNVLGNSSSKTCRTLYSQFQQFAHLSYLYLRECILKF